MQLLTISGNLGSDPQLRATQGGDDILSFSVGVKQGWGDKASSNWFRCSLWGKRARSLQQHLRKGVKVVVHGELTIGEYQDKPQYDIRVNEVEFLSQRDTPASGYGERKQSYGSGNAVGGRGDPFNADLDDEIPY